MVFPFSRRRRISQAAAFGAALALLLACPQPGRSQQSGRALRQADATPQGVSYTVPLVVDRKNNRLSVQALINDRKVRLILDTSEGPDISLDETTARGIRLVGRVPVRVVGGQGVAPAVVGAVKRFRLGGLTPATGSSHRDP